MDISYLGHSSFRIRGKHTTIVTDPFDSAMVGFPYPKHVSANIVTVSHDHGDHNSVSQIEGSPYIVSGPGEYEIQGVGIVGISTFHDGAKGSERGLNTMYRMEIDGISIVHVGDLGHALDSETVDALDGVDILLIPVGGFYTIDAEKAGAVIKEVEPSIVIPMHYFTPKHNAKAFGEVKPLDVFLKEMGKEGIVPVPKLTITKDKIPEAMQVVVLE